MKHVHPDDRILWVRSIPFFLIHIVAIVGVIRLGFSWSGVALTAVFYLVTMFGVMAGYHRYFSHRTFETSRVFAFLLGFLAETTAQKGIIWWASHHRHHHKHSDTTEDVHSMKLRGFVWSHVGWILAKRWEGTVQDRVGDLLRRPELVWLDRWNMFPPTALAVVLLVVGGPHALIWGFFVTTVLSWHATFTVNSLMHHFGSQRYETGDESKNSFFLALITLGEGWHNNHHYYQRSAAQGFFWWEIDITYYVLLLLQRLGIVWNVHRPPPAVLARTLEATRKAKAEAAAEAEAGEAEAAVATTASSA